MQSSMAVRGHFADLCPSNEASWGVPKLIHLYSFVTIGPVIYIYIYYCLLMLSHLRFVLIMVLYAIAGNRGGVQN